MGEWESGGVGERRIVERENDESEKRLPENGLSISFYFPALLFSHSPTPPLSHSPIPILPPPTSLAMKLLW